MEPSSAESWLKAISAVISAGWPAPCSIAFAAIRNPNGSLSAEHAGRGLLLSRATATEAHARPIVDAENAEASAQLHPLAAIESDSLTDIVGVGFR